MDKISGYIGKQRKNSEGELDFYFFPFFFPEDFQWISLFCVCFLLVSGPVESDPEYRLIVVANNLTVEIDNELSKLPCHIRTSNFEGVLCCNRFSWLHCLSSDIIHKFTRDKYSKRFPELESLVPDSLDYIRAVKVGYKISISFEQGTIMTILSLLVMCMQLIWFVYIHIASLRLNPVYDLKYLDCSSPIIECWCLASLSAVIYSKSLLLGMRVKHQICLVCDFCSGIGKQSGEMQEQWNSAADSH